MRRKDWGQLAFSALLGASLFAVSSALLSAHEASQRASAGASWLGIASHPYFAVIEAAPDFTLRDSTNRLFALSRLRGRVVLLSFIYTSCTTTCPLLTQRMALLSDELRKSGLWPSSVSFLSITVDPERDTAAALVNYARLLDAVDPNWRFLREQPPRLRPVLAAYDEWTKRLPDGDIDHPARVYLIDRRGDIREIYGISFFDERQVLVDIRTLLAEPG
jgi:protein SCO1/2